MQHSTRRALEQNRSVEWGGSRKDTNNRPACWVDDKARDQLGLFVAKIETEKKLPLPGRADCGQQRLFPESRPGERERAVWRSRTSSAKAPWRRCRASRESRQAKHEEAICRSRLELYVAGRTALHRRTQVGHRSLAAKRRPRKMKSAPLARER